MKAGGPPTKRCAQYEEKSLVGFFFFPVCARVCFQGDDINLVVAAERKKKGFTYSYTAHTAIKMVSPFLCVLILFSPSPRFFQILFPSVTNKIEPSTTGRVTLSPHLNTTLSIHPPPLALCVRVRDVSFLVICNGINRKTTLERGRRVMG